MRTVVRGLRSIYRAPLRAGLVGILLAVSIGLTLIMITVDEAFGERLDQVKAGVGTSVTVRPAGSFGFMGDGSLTDEDLAKITALPNVTSVERTLYAMYEGDLEPGGDLPQATLRTIDGTEIDPDDASAGTQARMVMPVIGTDSTTTLSPLGGGDLTLTAGRVFTADDEDANVAIIGEQLAEKNGLGIGSTIDVNGTAVEIVGLVSSGTVFGDNTIFMPLDTVRRLYDQTGQTSQLTLQVDSADNVEAVAEAVRNALGDDNVDVVTSTSQYEQISGSLQDAKRSSQIGMIAALVTSAAVILFTLFLVARQRVKEIGILKAVGATSGHVALQFGTETLVVAVVAAILGALATFPAAQIVANGLVSGPAGPQAFSAAGGQVISVAPIGGGTFSRGGGFLGDVDVAVSPEIFLYALALAIGLALLASVVPAWQVARVKPAEVLRYE